MRTLLISLPLLLAVAVPATAITMYGDVVGIDASLSGLQEATNSAGDPEPLFGAPTLIGNSLLFTPMDFVTMASGGTSDQTLATFQGVITANDKDAGGILSLSLHETGDYALKGMGTEATNVSAVGGLFVQILEINVRGKLVSDVILADDVFSFDLAAPDQFGDWEANALVDVAAAVEAEFGAGAFATVVSFTYDNDLGSNTEAGTNAFLQKKNLLLTTTVIPEPGTAPLLGLGLLGLAARPTRLRSGA